MAGNANLILMLLAFPPCYETDEGQEDKVGRANIQTPNSTNASLVPRAGVEDRERERRINNKLSIKIEFTRIYWKCNQKLPRRSCVGRSVGRWDYYVVGMTSTEQPIVNITTIQRPACL